MSDHAIPDHVKNSCLENCIDEYVRNVKHRAMLRDRWFVGLTIDQIAAKYDISATATKEVLYGLGDKILLRAASM